jgi:hypothetical protein
MGLLVVAVVAAMALSPAALLVPLYLWARWLRRRTGVPRFVRGIAVLLAALAAAVALFGAVASVHALMGAVTGESVGPLEKSRALAEGLSEAMNCGALAVVVAAVLALWLLFSTWRWHWRR